MAAPAALPSRTRLRGVLPRRGGNGDHPDIFRGREFVRSLRIEDQDPVPEPVRGGVRIGILASVDAHAPSADARVRLESEWIGPRGPAVDCIDVRGVREEVTKRIPGPVRDVHPFPEYGIC